MVEQGDKESVVKGVVSQGLENESILHLKMIRK